MAVATQRVTTVPVTVGGQEITFESGKLAKQEDGAVVVRSGETMVLATAQWRTEGAPPTRPSPRRSARALRRRS